MFLFGLKVMNRLKHWFLFYMLGVIFVLGSIGVSVAVGSENKFEKMYEVTKRSQLVIGARGSKNDLILTQLFYKGVYDKTIPYSLYLDLKNKYPSVNFTPLAIADSYNNSLIVGVDKRFIEDEGLSFSKGSVFHKMNEVVLGYDVAKNNNLTIGSSLISSHGVGELDKHDQDLKVVGILEKTNSTYDNVIFTSFTTIWDAHYDHSNDTHSEHDDTTFADHEQLTSILVKSSNMKDINEILVDFKTNDKYMAVSSVEVVRSLYNILDDTSKLLYYISFLVVGISLLYVMSTSLLLSSRLKQVFILLKLHGYSKISIGKFVGTLIGVVGVITIPITVVSIFIGYKWLQSVYESYGIYVGSMDVYMVLGLYMFVWVVMYILWLVYALVVKPS